MGSMIANKPWNSGRNAPEKLKKAQKVSEKSPEQGGIKTVLSPF
jgi:hypothetical protein